MVDALQRKLKVPPRFVPYMEKHRVYEVFQELMIQLVQAQPNDHILFMRQKLQEFMMCRNHPSPRVVILAPPQFDIAQLAAHLIKSTKMLAVHLQAVTDGKESEEDSNLPASELLALKTLRFLDTHKDCANHHHGWMLLDFPKNSEDARALQHKGIMPTHTIQLYPSLLQATLTFVSPLAKRIRQETVSKEIEEYRLNLLGLREAYKSTLIEVDIRERTTGQLAKSLSKIVLQQKHSGAQIVPRVLMIGSRGSGRKIQAKLLCKRFHLIHVDLDKLLARVRLEDDDLAHQVHLWESYLKPIDTATLAAIIERRIMERDCLDQGWVLTGYPTNFTQFQSLDTMDTPPNRVIFLEVEPLTCIKRITLRGVNVHTGSQHDLLKPRHSKKAIDYRNVVMHPRNEPQLVKKQLCYYRSNLKDMLLYTSGTEIIIDGNATLRTVTERVQSAIMRPPPLVAPRDSLAIIRKGSQPQSTRQIVKSILLDAVGNAVEEIDIVEGIVDMVIERVIDKVDRSHIQSVLDEIMNRQWRYSTKPLVHYDDEHECLAIVRGIPRGKRDFRSTEYGKFIAEHEQHMREYERKQEGLMAAEEEQEHIVQFLIDGVNSTSKQFVSGVVVSAVEKVNTIKNGSSRDLLVLPPPEN